jgi:glycerol uptake facilitator protein
VITTGWGLAVTMAVYAAGWVSGAHINPAVTVGLATGGELDAWLVPHFLVGQMIGAFVGAMLVYLVCLPHWASTDNPAVKLAAFSTGPEIRSPGRNFLTEVIGTFMLVFGIMMIVVGGGEAFGDTAGVDLRACTPRRPRARAG